MDGKALRFADAAASLDAEQIDVVDTRTASLAWGLPEQFVISVLADAKAMKHPQHQEGSKT